MTNAQIIFDKSIELMETGVIGTTGRKMKVAYEDENGDLIEKIMDEPEEIHTFADWKARGYFVKKGEKAVARFAIWNFTNKPSKAARTAAAAEGKEDLEADPHYYMKESCFFKLSQTSAAVKMLPAVIA